MRKIYEHIANSPNFILILSRGSLDRCEYKSDWLKREIMHAIKTNRNIITVIEDDFKWPSEDKWKSLPDAMKGLESFNAVLYSHAHSGSSLVKIASFFKTSDELEEFTKKISESNPTVIDIPSSELPKEILSNKIQDGQSLNQKNKEERRSPSYP